MAFVAQSDGRRAGGPTGRTIPRRPCEACGEPTSEHTLSLVNGSYVCPGCAASAAESRGRRLVWLIVGVAAVFVLIAGGVIWVANAHLAEKSQIARSLIALRAAALSADAERAIVPYIDAEAIYGDLRSAAAAAGDPEPDVTAQVLWRRVITTAIQGGTVTSLAGNRAALRKELNDALGGPSAMFVVEYEMTRTEGDTWRVTRVLNADEIYATYRTVSPLP